MVASKFDEHDRAKVVRELERRLGVELSHAGRRRKHYRDLSGKSYWVFGGYGNWHGISPDMIDSAMKNGHDGVLVVAKRDRKQIIIFSGPLYPLIEGRDRLSHTQKGDYHFNVRIHERYMYVNELPEVILRQLSTVPYTEEERERDKNFEKAKIRLDSLSSDERRKLLADFTAKGQ